MICNALIEGAEYGGRESTDTHAHTQAHTHPVSVLSVQQRGRHAVSTAVCSVVV